MNTHFQNKLHPLNTSVWLTGALTGKVLMVLLLCFTLNLPDKNGLFFIYGSDGHDYAKAAENIIEYGTYSYYGTNLEKGVATPNPFISRMPGYEIVFLFFRLFSSPSAALNFVIIFQNLLAAISVYCLALTARKIFSSDKIFYYTFFTYLFSSYIAIFDISILTESIAMSALILAVYFLFRQKSNTDYFYAGAWLTWGIFLRQYYIPIYILFFIYVAWITWRKYIKNYKKVFISVAFLTASFIVADSLWIIRNYIHTKKIIPVVDDLHGGAGKTPNVLYELMHFVESWGGDIIWWNPKSEMMLFMPTTSGIAFNDKEYTFESLPDYIYTSKYTVDSLKKVREYYLLSIDTATPADDKKHYENWLIKSLDEYTQSFKEEKKLHYYFYAPLKLLPRFIFHSGTYNLSNTPFAEQSNTEKAIKLFYTFLYWMVLTFGFVGAFYFILRRFSPETILISLIPLYIVLLCPLVLRRIEYRYLFPAYPFLVVIMSFMTYKILNKVSSKLRDIKQ